MKYKIGTQFATRGKHSKIHTVVDFYTTFNIMGELVKERYVTTHLMCGQKVYDYNIVETTIDMSTIISQDGHDNNKENE